MPRGETVKWSGLTVSSGYSEIHGGRYLLMIKGVFGTAVATLQGRENLGGGAEVSWDVSGASAISAAATKELTLPPGYYRLSLATPDGTTLISGFLSHVPMT